MLEKYNESPHVCKVVACLETSRTDPQVATKVAIENPLAAEDCPESLMPLDEFVGNLSKHANESGKAQFREIVKALLDIRLRVPPIYNLDSRFIIVDTMNCHARVILTPGLFERKREV